MATDWGALAELGLGLGTSLYGAYEKSRQNDNYQDALRAREQRNYDDSKAGYEAYQQYLNQWNQADAANSAASAASSRASAAAAAATERNRQKAAKKAQNVQNKAFGKSEALLKPYADVGLQLLPQVQAAYGGGLNNLNLLSAYVNDPSRMARMDTPTSALQTDFKLPDYLRYK